MNQHEIVGALADSRALGCARGMAVEVVHTHASTVVLCGDRAWKIKKPVKLGFLDFSTLERRRADCEREIALNRRLAPEIYLGLSALVRRGATLAMVDAASPGEEVVEWAVRMRRMPAEGMLDVLVPRGGVSIPQMRAFAVRLADFHARPESSVLGPEHGCVDQVAARIRANLAQLAHHVRRHDGILEPEFLDALHLTVDGWIARIAPTLQDRRAHGRVRDGHGDLHARNLCMIDGRITAYDCLEFDDALRCADVAADVGFLAMDLARLGRQDLAHEFVQAYAERSGDAGIAEPARFFGIHYAVVRAMVEAIRLGQAQTSDRQRAGIIRTIRQYALLAAGLSLERATVIMMGLPATGKSTLGVALARYMEAEVLESDRIRKQLHGIGPTDRGSPAMYGADATARTYAALAERARSIRGTVVIDASHHTRAQRASSIAAAVARGGPWLLVEVHADAATIASRMERRAMDPSRVSDATIGVHQTLSARREAPQEVDLAHHLPIESCDSPDWVDLACQRALQKLMLSDAAHGVP